MASGFEELRNQNHWQDTAIDYQIDLLKRRRTELDSKSQEGKLSTAEGKERDLIGTRIQGLRQQQVKLDAAYLKDLYNLLDLDSTLKALGDITSKMQKVAGEMKTVTEEINNASSLIGFAGDAIKVLDGAPKKSA